MFNTTEKKERALGTKLFLKAERCVGAKCATVRRPTRPGMHGKARRRALSEYGEQLQEKQKFQFSYGLREAQMRRIFKEALKDPAVTAEMMVGLLERRLDNVVYRLGFAQSRSIGRQLVSHGHIFVNGRKVSIPSFRVKTGDSITVRPESKDHPVIKKMEEYAKNYNAPAWLAMDTEKKEGKILAMPRDFDTDFDASMVVDYYSKIVK